MERELGRAGNSRLRGGPPPLGESVRRVVEGIGRLVREHMALLRAELASDLKKAARDAAFAAAGLPALLLGWAFVMVAVALWIGHALGNAWGFAIVGAVNAIAGGTLAAIFGGRLAGKDRPRLDRTAIQLREDGQWLEELRRS